MSLPPLSQINKLDPQMQRKCLYYKFSSPTAQILNPIFSLKSNLLLPGATIKKACDVMSPHPPCYLGKSKFSISRLSPALPTIKSPKKNINSYLKKKYLANLQLENKPSFSIAFTDPIRDYFQETIETEQRFSNPESEPDQNVTPIQVDFKAQKYLKPRYSNVVMPIAKEAEKSVNKEIRNNKFKDKKEKKPEISIKVTNRSLQTDTKKFEFDEWEFDYNA